MLNRIYHITLLLLYLSWVSIPSYAHDGSDHALAALIEMWVSGVGIALIILACIYSLWWKNPDRKSSENKPLDTDSQVVL